MLSAGYAALNAETGTSTALISSYLLMLFGELRTCHEHNVILPTAPIVCGVVKQPVAPTIYIAVADEANFYDSLDFRMVSEARKVAGQKAYIRSLKDRAAAGTLRDIIGDVAGEPLAAKESWTQPRGAGHELTPAKAAEWTTAVRTLNGGGWRNPATIKAVWSSLVAISGGTPPPDVRPQNRLETRYASSIVDSSLLGFITALADTLPAPAAGAPAWKDLALFMLGSLVHAQAFTDANKRISYSVYYAVLHDGGMQFFDPSAVTHGLFNM